MARQRGQYVGLIVTRLDACVDRFIVWAMVVVGVGSLAGAFYIRAWL